jgi:hypothetical protein
VNLLENIYRQQIEFRRRNIEDPDLLLMPYLLRHQFLGEVLCKYATSSFDPAQELHVMGLRVIYIETGPVTVALSAARLK